MHYLIFPGSLTGRTIKSEKFFAERNHQNNVLSEQSPNISTFEGWWEWGTYYFINGLIVKILLCVWVFKKSHLKLKFILLNPSRYSEDSVDILKTFLRQKHVFSNNLRDIKTVYDCKIKYVQKLKFVRSWYGLFILRFRIF